MHLDDDLLEAVLDGHVIDVAAQVHEGEATLPQLTAQRHPDDTPHTDKQSRFHVTVWEKGGGQQQHATCTNQYSNGGAGMASA